MLRFRVPLARAAAGLLPDSMEAVALPNPGSLPLFNQDVLDEGMPESVNALITAVEGVDALLIVTPEYNWSIPGGLKNAIDWLSRANPAPFGKYACRNLERFSRSFGAERVCTRDYAHTLLSQDMLVMAKPEVQIGGAKGKIDVGANRITNADTEAFLRSHLSGLETFCNSWRGE